VVGQASQFFVTAFTLGLVYGHLETQLEPFQFGSVYGHLEMQLEPFQFE
jgi:hypothetical protein